MAKTRKKQIKWKLVEKHLNKPVIVTFDDHADGFNLVFCKVIGWLGEIEDKHIMIVTWDVPEEEGDSRTQNMEAFTIVKSTIYDIKPLGLSTWGK